MINDDDKISVIIGTYNRETLVARTLDSVLNQTYKNIELVVVDDCSVDKTLSVLEKYSCKYPDKIKIVKNERNMGIAFNCNKGFEIADGQYIALIGDDDYWLDKKKLQKQIRILRSNNTLGIVGTWWKEESEVSTQFRKPSEPKDWCETLLSGGGVICGSTPLIRRNAWEKVGGFDENQKRGTDSDLFRRIVLAGFGAKLLKEVTTAVDVTKSRVRMTEKGSLSSYSVHISAMKYNLSKLSMHYENYPKAKNTYYEKLTWLYFKKYRVSRDPSDLHNHNFYLKEMPFLLKIKICIKKLLDYLKGAAL